MVLVQYEMKRFLCAQFLRLALKKEQDCRWFDNDVCLKTPAVRFTLGTAEEGNLWAESCRYC